MKKKLLFLMLSVFCLSGCKFAEKERYEITQGYIGNIFIFTNVKSATPSVYIEGKRLYNIPKEGILLTRFKETYGIINKEFFYVANKSKVRIPGIQYQEDKRKLDKNKIYAFFGRDMTITFPKMKDTIGLQIITICTPTQYEYFENDQFLEKFQTRTSPLATSI